MSKENNINSIEELFRAIDLLIDERIAGASFDKTFNARVVALKEDNVATVRIRNQNYDVELKGNQQIAVGDVVKVVQPQNNMNDIFILGKM